MAGHRHKRVNRDKGLRSEQRALDYLLAEGLTLLSRNYRCRLGEIDLVMKDQDCLVFVEVRYRAANRFADAAGSVDLRKQVKIRRTAQYYLGRHRELTDYPVRFDVVAFDGAEVDQCRLQWTKDAFRV